MPRYESDWREMEARVQELETALELRTQEVEMLRAQLDENIEIISKVTTALREAVLLAKKKRR